MFVILDDHVELFFYLKDDLRQVKRINLALTCGWITGDSVRRDSGYLAHDSADPFHVCHSKTSE